MKFWKSFSASLLAVAIGVFTIIGAVAIGIAILFSLFSFDVEPERVSPNSVLYIDLAENIVESPRVSPLGDIDPTSMTFTQSYTLMEMLSSIEKAQNDPNIKGICINPNGQGVVSNAILEEMRRSLEKFKTSGKFVVAYDDYYTQSDYYLASVADHIILCPEGSVDWHGVAFTSVFFKGLLDKIDAKVEVFRPSSCKYKSGVEPFIYTKMSDADRKQMSILSESMWLTIVETVSASRSISAEHLRDLAYNLELSSADDALAEHFVDKLGYEDDLLNYFQSKGIKKNSKGEYNTITLGEYISMNKSNTIIEMMNGDIMDMDMNMEPKTRPNSIAVVYADGEIVDGNMFADNYVFGTSLASQLRQARLDKNTKAVVLRVNSPGGSALASDVVWREMQLLQQNKVVVVSMGEYAASGGYYISAPADYIVANNITLTGSIGVFGMSFNIEETLRKHLGITFDSVGSSPSAGGMTITRPLTTAERNNINKGIDRVYDTFTSIVAEGRNMPKESVYEIAEGRVWSGRDAQNIGLVDAIGGLNESILVAAELADIEKKYSIYEISYGSSLLTEWINIMSSFFAKSNGIDQQMYGKYLFDLFMNNPYLLTNQGIQARMPMDISMNM